MAEKQEKKKKQPSEVDNLKATVTDLTDSIKRLQAEFENYKKRTNKEKLDFTQYACANVISKLLPILDSFEAALKNNKLNDGTELILKQFEDILHAEGLKKIQTDGQKFDPYKHEVMMQEESEKEDGVILEELQSGYELNGHVIRHSKVKISKNSGGKNGN